MLLLLVMPSTIMLAGNDGSPSLLAHAQDQTEDEIEDVADGEDDADSTVEADDEDAPADTAVEDATTDDEDEEEEEKPLKPSPDADTHILFTQPQNMEFPAGKPVRILVGFTNNGDKDFVVESMDASFRYPQDFSYHIQNFTTVRFSRQVEPGRQATFEYGFAINEAFSSRPFGLVVVLDYKDLDGNIFQDAVYNETITISDPDDGLDGETFFLYLFMAAMAVLLVVGAQQLMASFGKKRSSKPKPAMEMGTQNQSDIDYDWIPKETLEERNRSPGRSPKSKTSPRARRNNKKGSASSED